uniref:Uncharacterized protein n=1 Tax=viral metagenome TaxID=1070528 RepID=A0A6M3LLA3_9ZZZZ
MGDLFDEQVLMEWQEAVFIHTYRAPHHKYFFLSKQVLNMQKIVTEWFKYRAFGMPKKLYWGVSITSQADADRMIPELLRIPGKKWISLEPQLEKIDISNYIGYTPINHATKEASHEAKFKREDNLRVGKNGGIADRRIREDMESKEKNREENGWNPFEAMQESQGGKGMGTISSGSSDAKLEKIPLRSASDRISPFLWGDTKGIDDQPQEREKNGQQAMELGDNDLLSKHGTCGPRIESGEMPESERREKRLFKIEGCPSNRNSSFMQRKENESNGNREEIRYRQGECMENLSSKNMEASPISLIVLGCHNRPSIYPCPHEWMIDVVEQCKSAAVKCFVKQVGIGGKVCTDITKFPKELQVREWPDR